MMLTSTICSARLEFGERSVEGRGMQRGFVRVLAASVRKEMRIGAMFSWLSGWGYEERHVEIPGTHRRERYEDFQIAAFLMQ